jgi:glutathione synthase/RimK-type ligase-like ATP-grasp enzyme
MEQPCILLAKKNNGTWWTYSKQNPVWVQTSGVNSILRDRDSNIINWGNHIYANGSFFKLNKPHGIANASNKAKCRMILQSKHIAVPKTQLCNQRISINFPIIIRPPHHSKGHYFYLFQDIEELAQCNIDIGDHWYASEVFEKTNEYRIHCGHGRIILIKEKPLIDGEIRANQAINRDAWSYIGWDKYNREMCVASLKAIKAVELDYGAVDIMYNSNNETFAIAEINTSPTLSDSPYNCKKYAKYFNWCIENNFPRHFNINNRRKNIFKELML